MIDLGKQVVDIDCPGCGQLLSVTLNQVSNGDQVNCTGCLQPIRLVESGNGISDVKKSLDDFEKNLKSINKKLKI